MRKLFEQYGIIIVVTIVIVALIATIIMVAPGDGTGWMEKSLHSLTTGFSDKVDSAQPEQGGSGGSGEADHDAPTLTVGPELSQDINLPTVVESNSITLSGTVSDASGIASLTVNGNDVTVDGSGAWSYTLALTQNEVTEVTVEAKDNAGNTTTKSGYVEYIIYTEVSVGKSAYAEEIGYSDDVSVLNIPGTFEKDGTWYKVTAIKSKGFYACNNLTKVVIPNTVTKIGSKAFDSCSNLNSVVFENESNLNYIESEAFQKCSSLVTFTIPDGTKSIGSATFRDCSSLESIAVPDSLKSLGANGTFARCSSLKTIYIPEGVTAIDGSVFLSCTALDNITIPSTVSYINTYAFAYCSNLKNLTIKNGVTKIMASSFSYCKALTSVTIPNSVQIIEKYAFYYSSLLENITFEGTVAQWNAIDFGDSWSSGTAATEVVCSDGTVSLK